MSLNFFRSLKSSKRLALFSLLIIALAMGGLAVWYFKRPLGLGKTEPPKVRIGYLPIIADLPLFVALEKGYFQKRQLDVEAVRFESSPTMSTAFVNNEIAAVASIASTVALSIESRDPGR
jgi:ABC-type nitrate/sulfonate/bicarbonate transport system substrate-binding protein